MGSHLEQEMDCSGGLTLGGARLKSHVKTIELSNHLILPYMEKGSKSGKVLILLHGVADSYLAFEPIFPFLSEEYRTISVTLRGHGDACKPMTGYSSEDFAEDLLLFMNELVIDKAVILGASSGGFAARSFAVRYPERTDGLILLGSPSTLGDKLGAKQMWDEVISKLKDPVGEAFVRAFAQGLDTTKMPKDFLEAC